MTSLALTVKAEGETLYHTLSLRVTASKERATTEAADTHDCLGSADADLDVPVGATQLTIRSRNYCDAANGPADDGHDDYFDPCFFDDGYSIAAATAHSVWEGSLVLLEFLLVRNGTLNHDIRRSRILELGSGTGLLGLGVAHFIGGSVMCTDIASVTSEGGWLWQNSLGASPSGAVERHAQQRTPRQPWLGARAFGCGSVAGPQPLDWSVPLSIQRYAYANDPANANVIVAAECVWLKELAPLFVETVDALLSAEAAKDSDGRPRVCYWAYTERGTPESRVFTTLGDVVSLFASKGCQVTEVHRARSSENSEKWITINVVTKKM